MGYSLNDSVVRADRFKPSGKWSDTIALDMSGSEIYHATLVQDAVHEAMERQGVSLEANWSIVVLEPHHKNTHPVMIKGT